MPVKNTSFTVVVMNDKNNFDLSLVLLLFIGYSFVTYRDSSTSSYYSHPPFDLHHIQLKK